LAQVISQFDAIENQALEVVDGLANVRFGSIADIRTAKSYVRFTPESGHVRCS
jgi:hypothetical protein